MFERTGVSEVGKVLGSFVSKCDQPRILDRLRMLGIQFDRAVFEECLEIA